MAKSPGRVFQIDAAGKPFVLLDSPYTEIHALRVDSKGNIYAAAVSGQGGPAPDRTLTVAPEAAPAQPVASVSTEVTSITIVAEPAAIQAANAAPGPAAPRAQGGLGAGAVYRISPDGSQSTASASLCFTAAGRW